MTDTWLDAYDGTGNTSHFLADPLNKVIATDLRLELNISSASEICMRPIEKERSWSLITSAYADMAINVYYQHVDSIVNYDIYSDNIYDPSHPAGTSLRGVFSADDNYLINPSGSEKVKFNLYCEAAPADTGTHVFTLALAHKSGDTTYVNSIPIKLLK
jgi:hypothetical protein